jgi:hypothetical protein
MYSLKNLWSQEPAAIAEAVRQVLIVVSLVLAGMGMSDVLPDALVLGIVSLTSILLTLLTRNSVSSPATVTSLTASANAVLDALAKAQQDPSTEVVATAILNDATAALDTTPTLDTTPQP